MGKPRSESVQSVERALSLLELLADHGGRLTLAEIAAASQLPPPTAHRLLQTLAAQAYVRQDDDRRYALGTALLGLGHAAGRLIASHSQAALGEIADFSGETTNLAMMEDDRVVYLAQATGRHRMRMFTEVGRRVLPHSTAVGKVLLAWQPESAIRQVLDRFGLPRRTARTVTDAEQFLRELVRVRQRGYAIDDEEEEEGVRCVAVPVGPGPDAFLSISVSAPASRLSRHHRQLIDRMTEAGQQLHRSLREARGTTS